MCVRACIPACLIPCQQRSPVLQDASPISPSTGTEQGNAWLAVTTSHKTHTKADTHTPSYLLFLSNILTSLMRWKQKHLSLIVRLKYLLVHSSQTFILLFTLADALNFSCSGLLCSSYSTTPSGPLAVAVNLLSPAALPRLPLAASSWVSRRLWEERERRHKRIIVFNTPFSLTIYHKLLIVLCTLSFPTNLCLIAHHLARIW